MHSEMSLELSRDLFFEKLIITSDFNLPNCHSAMYRLRSTTFVLTTISQHLITERAKI